MGPRLVIKLNKQEPPLISMLSLEVQLHPTILSGHIQLPPLTIYSE